MSRSIHSGDRGAPVESSQPAEMARRRVSIVTDLGITATSNDQALMLVSPSSSKRSIDAVDEAYASQPLSTRRRSSTAKQSSRSSMTSESVTASSATSRRRTESRGDRSEIKPEFGSDTYDVQEVDEEKGGGQPGSKERSREKNKVAAAKCRAKKRENMEVIETNHRSLSAENTYLKKHEQQLRATVAELRTLALDHQHCNCGVHQYNMIQAGNLARGLGDLHMQHFGNCAVHSASGSTVSSAILPNFQNDSPSQDTSSPGSSDINPMSQMGSLNQMTQGDQVDMGFDLEHDNLFDLQTPMDTFFAEFNGSTEYSQGL